MEMYAMLQSLQSPLSLSDRERLTRKLEDHIRFLISNDFDRLVQLLYSIDIDEEKLKTLLQQQPLPDAASIIGAMIIQRQLQKQVTSKQYRFDVMDDAERW